MTPGLAAEKKVWCIRLTKPDAMEPLRVRYVSRLCRSGGYRATANASCARRMTLRRAKEALADLRGDFAACGFVADVCLVGGAS